MVFLWCSPLLGTFPATQRMSVQVDWRTLAPPQLVNHYEHLGESAGYRGDLHGLPGKIPWKNSKVYQGFTITVEKGINWLC